MTTERQRAANRANARKSTGPKTADGRKRSAGNARRHGVTAALPHEQVRAWYRLVLGDEDAEPDSFESDPVRRAAYGLAEAEVRLARVKKAEEAYLLDYPQADALAAEAAALPNDTVTGRRAAARMATYAASLSKERSRELRTLGRYRVEAEAQRSKALRAFITAQQAKSRNEANFS